MKSMSFFRPFIRKHVREGYKISREGYLFHGNIFWSSVLSNNDASPSCFPYYLPSICITIIIIAKGRNSELSLFRLDRSILYEIKSFISPLLAYVPLLFISYSDRILIK